MFKSSAIPVRPDNFSSEVLTTKTHPAFPDWSQNDSSYISSVCPPRHLPADETHGTARLP